MFTVTEDERDALCDAVMAFRFGAGNPVERMDRTVVAVVEKILNDRLGRATGNQAAGHSRVTNLRSTGLIR